MHNEEEHLRHEKEAGPRGLSFGIWFSLGLWCIVALFILIAYGYL